MFSFCSLGQFSTIEPMLTIVYLNYSIYGREIQHKKSWDRSKCYDFSRPITKNTVDLVCIRPTRWLLWLCSQPPLRFTFPRRPKESRFVTLVKLWNYKKISNFIMNKESINSLSNRYTIRHVGGFRGKFSASMTRSTANGSLLLLLCRWISIMLMLAEGK